MLPNSSANPLNFFTFKALRMKDNEAEDKKDRNVFKLLSQLRKEKLFITSEKSNIQKLNKAVCITKSTTPKT